MMPKKLLLVSGFLLAFTSVAIADKALSLIKVKGSVNTQEIGGSGLSVFSLWGSNRGAAIGVDGVFMVVISDVRPQKLSVKDGNNLTRALAIALPEGRENIVFDARSTAAAVLFHEPGLLTSSAKVKSLMERMDKNKSFQEFAAFLKKKLPQRSLESLLDDPQCNALIEKCNADIFGEDTKAILESLRVAKGKLEESFHNGAVR
jgi:hypothetical protein